MTDREEPVAVPYDALPAATLRALIESYVLREGTDYGEHEALLETKVEEVRRQLERGDAHIYFDPASESVAIVRSGGERPRAV